MAKKKIKKDKPKVFKNPLKELQSAYSKLNTLEEKVDFLAKVLGVKVN